METRMVPVMELLGKQQRLGAVENLDMLKANIGEYGMLAPVMLDRHYHIVAGCEQFLAAAARGAAFVPAVFEHQLDQDERIYVRGVLRSEVQEPSWDELVRYCDRYMDGGARPDAETLTE